MVPIRDDNPTKIVPIVTYGLIIINLVMFGYELSLGEELTAFFNQWAVVPKLLTLSFQGQPTGLPHPAWLTLITSQFLHGGFLHIAGNMLFLWIFGNNIEEQLGSIKYLFFYLACGVLAGLSQWFFSAMSEVPSLGASGAIAGIMGAYILKFPQAKIVTVVPLGFFFPLFKIPAVYFLGFWFLEQAFNGIASFEIQSAVGMDSGGVAYWAHAGGFIFGAILAPMLGLFGDRRQTN